MRHTCWVPPRRNRPRSNERMRGCAELFVVRHSGVTRPVQESARLNKRLKSAQKRPHSPRALSAGEVGDWRTGMRTVAHAAVTAVPRSRRSPSASSGGQCQPPAAAAAATMAAGSLPPLATALHSGWMVAEVTFRRSKSTRACPCSIALITWHRNPVDHVASQLRVISQLSIYLASENFHCAAAKTNRADSAAAGSSLTKALLSGCIQRKRGKHGRNGARFGEDPQKNRQSDSPFPHADGRPRIEPGA